MDISVLLNLVIGACLQYYMSRKLYILFLTILSKQVIHEVPSLVNAFIELGISRHQMWIS